MLYAPLTNVTNGQAIFISVYQISENHNHYLVPLRNK